MRTIIALGVTVALMACGGETADEAAPEPLDTAPEPAAADTIATTYAPELEVDLATFTRTDSGLYYKDLAVGSGDPVLPMQTAVVHYTGWLTDGTEIDSSRETGEPLEFLLGGGQVIPGWEEGVAGMQPGGRRKLVIPPGLGYGAAGAGIVVPPYATLVFDVELVEIR